MCTHAWSKGGKQLTPQSYMYQNPSMPEYTCMEQRHQTIPTTVPHDHRMYMPYMRNARTHNNNGLHLHPAFTEAHYVTKMHTMSPDCTLCHCNAHFVTRLHFTTCVETGRANRPRDLTLKPWPGVRAATHSLPDPTTVTSHPNRDTMRFVTMRFTLHHSTAECNPTGDLEKGRLCGEHPAGDTSRVHW